MRFIEEKEVNKVLIDLKSKFSSIIQPMNYSNGNKEQTKFINVHNSLKDSTNFHNST